MLFRLSYYLLVALLTALGNSCSSANKQRPEMVAIEVRDTSTSYGPTYYRVCKFDSIWAYEYRSLFDSTEAQLRIDSVTGETLSDPRLVLREWRSAYFVFHKDSSYGHYYLPVGRQEIQREKVDQAVYNIKGGNRYDSFLTVKPDTILQYDQEAKIKEVFLLRSNDSFPGGRMVFHYSKGLRLAPLTFNGKVDSIKKAKLFRIEVYLNGFLDKRTGTSWPPYFNITEMKVMHPDSTIGLKSAVNAYKRLVLEKLEK